MERSDLFCNATGSYTSPSPTNYLPQRAHQGECLQLPVHTITGKYRYLQKKITWRFEDNFRDNLLPDLSPMFFYFCHDHPIPADPLIQVRRMTIQKLKQQRSFSPELT